jgi:hypothetical protein
VIRIILLAGAAACVVIGGKMAAQDIAYQMYDSFSLLITVIPFVPLISMAPRYKNGEVIYGFTAIVEATVIVANYFMVLR